MADETVNHIDREDAAMELAAIGNLIMWITQARDLIDEIQGHASFCGEPLNVALRSLNIRYNTPEWLQDRAGDGMTYLLLRQGRLIAALA